MLQYLGYIGKYEIDTDANLIHGEVEGIRDVVTFQARNVEDLKKAFKESVDDYLEFCKSRGEEPDRAYSGKISIRISPSIHRKLYLKAKREDTSMNHIIEEALSSTIKY